MQKLLSWTTFEGNWSTDLKRGIPASAAYIEAFDVRKSPSQMSVLPKATQDGQGVVSDLIQNSVETADGVYYFLGSSGNFYKRAAGVWSLIGNVGTGYFGLNYRPDMDAIYIVGAKAVSFYQPLSGTPTLSVNQFGISQSTYNDTDNAGFNVNTNQSGSTSTFTLPTSLTESKLRYFRTDIEPLTRIAVFVVAKGTGDWTLTLHDGLNNPLATATLTNAQLTSNQWAYFDFSQVRASVAPAARTYHIHVTSTVADGTVSASTLNDMTTIDLEVWADRLVIVANGMHPMATFQQFEVIGNDRYLSVWEPLGTASPDNSEWQRHKLVFPPEYQVCSLAVLNEFVAVGCQSRDGTGIIFWWDGLSETYNYFTKLQAPPYSMHEYQNVVYYVANGVWYAIAGYNSVPVKLRTLPNTQSEFSGVTDTTVVYPYTSTVRRDVHLLGFPSTTTNPNMQYGVYSWGAVDKNYPQSFGLNYILSSGQRTNANGLTIGHVKNYGDTLFISWYDSVNGYGLDVVDNTSKPASYATWQSMIFDNGDPRKLKQAINVEAYWTDLPDGAQITLMYKIDRGDWVRSQTYSSTDLWFGREDLANFAVDSDNGGRFHEIQVGIEVTCDSTVTQPPVINQIAFVFDDLDKEMRK